MHVYMVAGHGSVAVPSTQTIVCPRSRSHQAMFILPFTNYQLPGIFGEVDFFYPSAHSGSTFYHVQQSQQKQIPIHQLPDHLVLGV